MSSHHNSGDGLAVATVGFLAALAGIAALTGWLRRSRLLPGRRTVALVFLVWGVAGLIFLGATIAVAPNLLGLAERVCLLGILGWVFGVSRAIRGVDAPTAVSRPGAGRRVRPGKQCT